MMAATPEQKRLARLRLLPDEKLQQARQQALRRIRDIEIVQRERKAQSPGA